MDEVVRIDVCVCVNAGVCGMGWGEMCVAARHAGAYLYIPRYMGLQCYSLVCDKNKCSLNVIL